MNLSAIEACLVAGGRHLPTIVGTRQNKLHPGTTESNTLVSVAKVDVQQLTKVATSLKVSMLGAAQVKDPSRPRAGTRDDGHESEPLSWSPVAGDFMAELLHRFRPRMVTLLCASDPAELLSMFETKTPVVAFCCPAASRFCSFMPCHDTLLHPLSRNFESSFWNVRLL